ncbi:MAG: TIR domain-containing protein [Promethearchaeota archaeon]
MKIFLSYASDDQNEYKIEEIVDFLEYQDDIEHVYYWERDTKGGQTFDDYMTSNIATCELIIVLFTKNTKNSIPVIQEIGMAKAFHKKIMPIFVEIENIFANIKSSRGVHYSSDFRVFCEDLYYKITKKQAKFKEENPLMYLRKQMHQNFIFNKLNYVEPEFRAISDVDENGIIEDTPLISYRIINFIIFDPLNRGSLIIVNGSPGSGKSVLLASLKYDILHREQLSSYIPYLIDANDLNIVNGNLLNALYDYILPNTEKRYISYFQENIETGKGIFLIDGLKGSSNPKELLKMIYEFAYSYNARIIITCLPIIQEYIRDLSLVNGRYHIYELNTFKPSSLFEWIVLNKNNFDKTRNFQASQIYFVLKMRVREKEEKGERVLLPILMQGFSLD